MLRSDSAGCTIVTIDPPGSINTVSDFISPQGVIVGSYNDNSPAAVSHGFILDGGKYTVVDAPGAAGTVLSGINPSGEISGFTCTDPACGFTGNRITPHSFVISPKGDYTFFDPPGANRNAGAAPQEYGGDDETIGIGRICTSFSTPCEDLYYSSDLTTQKQRKN